MIFRSVLQSIKAFTVFGISNTHARQVPYIRYIKMRINHGQNIYVKKIDIGITARPRVQLNPALSKPKE